MLTGSLMNGGYRNYFLSVVVRRMYIYILYKLPVPLVDGDYRNNILSVLVFVSRIFII